MKVLFCGTGWFPVVEAIRLRAPAGTEVAIADPTRPLWQQVPGIEVLLPSNGGARREVIEAASALRLVQQPAVGVDGIDLAAARARNIPVCNAPDTNADSVAQAALLAILALARQLPRAQEAFRKAEIGQPVGMELNGKHLLLVGRGASARRLEPAAAALGMTVALTGSTTSRQTLLEEAARADFVSLHCPLTEQTRGMIDREFFTAMKRGGFLINCARGPIVDRTALEDALQEGRLAGAGLDTYWAEPWNPADPLYSRQNVLTLPHVAGSTEESFARIATIVAENLRRLANGEALVHRVV